VDCGHERRYTHADLTFACALVIGDGSSQLAGSVKRHHGHHQLIRYVRFYICLVAMHDQTYVVGASGAVWAECAMYSSHFSRTNDGKSRFDTTAQSISCIAKNVYIQ